MKKALIDLRTSQVSYVANAIAAEGNGWAAGSQRILSPSAKEAKVIDCPDSTKVGMVYSRSEGTFSLPVVWMPTREDYISAMEEMYDSAAQTRSYDNRITCAMRSGYPGPFQAEGVAFGTWMDTCNALAYKVMADVMAGSVPQPTVTGLLDMLPAMIWPE